MFISKHQEQERPVKIEGTITQSSPFCPQVRSKNATKKYLARRNFKIAKVGRRQIASAHIHQCMQRQTTHKPSGRNSMQQYMQTTAHEIKWSPRGKNKNKRMCGPSS
jgi:hypothetical protein